MRVLAAMMALKLLAMIAAIALALGLNGTTQVWELPTTDGAPSWVLTTTAPTPTVITVTPPMIEERPCVTVPIHREADGDLYLGSQAERVLTGGLEMGDIRISLVGHFVNIAFGQSGVDSWDMTLSSIDVTDITEVTICQ